MYPAVGARTRVGEVCTSPVIHRHVGASAFIADYRAGQLLPQESHPSQHSCLSSASPTRSVGQARWHRPTSTRTGLRTRFGSLLWGKDKPHLAQPEPSARQDTAAPQAAGQTLLGASSQRTEQGIAAGPGLALREQHCWLAQKQRGQGTGPQALRSSPHVRLRDSHPTQTSAGGFQELAQPEPGRAVVPPALSSTWWPW